MRAALLLFFSCFLCAASAVALPAAAPLVDVYNLLPRHDNFRLTQELVGIKQKAGVEVTIYVPTSLGGKSIEEVSLAAAETWKLGRKKEDKGLLIVIAPNERKMRIEVGYGLEGLLTDAFCRQVLDENMRPLFRQNRFYDGIMSALLRIQEKLPLGLTQPVPEPESPANAFLMVCLFFILFMFLLGFLSRIARRDGFGSTGWGSSSSSWGSSSYSSGSSWSSSSSSSSGSWGGGGGSFGGGGSSSSW